MQTINDVVNFVRDIFLKVTKQLVNILSVIVYAMYKVITKVLELAVEKPVREVMYFLSKNAYALIKVSKVVVPIVFIYATGIEYKWLIIYIIGMFMLWVAQSIIEDAGWETTTIPVPEVRFTTVSSDGEVEAEHERLSEMLLYVASVEDYLERTGKAKWTK